MSTMNAWIFKGCLGEPGLCGPECFEEFHIKLSFAHKNESGVHLEILEDVIIMKTFQTRVCKLYHVPDLVWMYYMLCRDGLVHIWKNWQLCALCLVQSYSVMKGLKHDVTVVPHSLVPTSLCEFSDSKGHQGTIHVFEERSYWCPNYDRIL